MKTIALVAGNIQEALHFFDTNEFPHIDVANTTAYREGLQVIYISRPDKISGLLVDELIETGTAKDRGDYREILDAVEARIKYTKSLV